MIAAQGVTKRFGVAPLAYEALRGVSLDVAAGEVVLLVGPSGSGKTTLLSIIGCVLSPTSGTVKLCGTDIGTYPEQMLPDLRLNLIGFVFQGHNLITALSAKQNVRLPLLMRGFATKHADELAEQMLVKVGLGDKFDSLPRDLSGGQNQRVAIARALVGSPPIVLADEPTAALDGRTGQEVMETLTSLAHQAGHAVLIVTHDPRIFPFGDRVVHMEDGTLKEKP
jgi:putative ABC transport system ATP-binding protein